jgi:thiol-disulfide isomerase/thioredoxin
MSRYWAIALLVLVPAALVVIPAAGGGKAGKDLRFDGKLTVNDPKDPKRNAAFKTHVVKLRKGVTYTIDMISTQFDNYLRLLDASGKELAEDDDSGGMQNARIIFNCQMDGDYKIIATAYNENGVGDYVLTVRNSGNAPKFETAHAALVGKPAPDFQADFILNGKAKAPSELKGRVVLLNFWTPMSGPCQTAFPKLREWSKAHKADGLEVVGVTFYQHEIGQNIGFDKSTGKLTKLERSDRATEQAMLREFAAYHQLDYLMTVLTKDDALAAYNAYVVNGVPQCVLIDRRGVVRFITVGDREAAFTALEAEIKKVLEAK